MKNLIHNYLRYLYQSLTSISFYHEVQVWSIKKNISFFVITLVVVGLARGVYIAHTQIPVWKSSVNHALEELIANYPEDLVIDWDGNQLSTNQPIVTVYYPSNFNPTEYNLPQPLALIAPNQNLDQGTPIALFVANNTQLTMRSGTGETQTFDLHAILNTEPMTITEQNIATVTQNFEDEQVIPVLNQAMYVVPILVALSLPISSFAIALLEGTLLFVVLRLYSKSPQYLPVLQLALHLMVTAQIVNQIVQTLYPSFNYSMTSITFWALAIYATISGNFRKKIFTS